jgi:GTP-binding protein
LLIRSVVFHRAAYSPADFVRDGRPQFAFVGRSNVGKSTLINAVLGRKNVARVSQTPGKTQAVQYYLVNEKIHLVDLPGYGYAKVSKELRHSWAELMERFFGEAVGLQALFLLLDARREPTDEDVMMLEMSRSVGVPVEIVMTKVDKLSGNELARSRKAIAGAMDVDPKKLIAFSSLTRQGVDLVWRRIGSGGKEKLKIEN